MIKSRNDILFLLNEYINTKHEINYQWFSADAEKSSAEKQTKYRYDIVLGKLQERDISTIQTLKMGVSDVALRDEINQYYAREIKAQKELEHHDIIKQRKLENLEKEFQGLRALPIDEWIKQYDSWIRELKEVDNLPDHEVKVLLFLYYAFKNYSAIQQSPYSSDINYLTETYKSIFDKQSQFCKYGLVPIDCHRMLLLLNPPRIYDHAINKTFFTKNIPVHLLKIFSCMMSHGMINSLAVRLLNEPGYEGCMSGTYLMEAVERGKPFDLANLGSYSVSKLYSTQYEDCLWINIDPQNITFEELCSDFDNYEEMIVTQVVHLQYANFDGDIYITHLDHEYIFYSLNEYTKRLDDINQKGTAKQRMKSFKIDNSKIPFTFRCEISRKDENGKDLPVEQEQFLCYVLDCYFKHKDLLSEYFQKVIS